MNLQEWFLLSGTIFFVLSIIFVVFLAIIVTLVYRKATEVEKNINQKINLASSVATAPFVGILKTTATIASFLSTQLRNKKT